MFVFVVALQIQNLISSSFCNLSTNPQAKTITNAAIAAIAAALIIAS